MAIRFMWECEDNIFIAEDTSKPGNLIDEACPVNVFECISIDRFSGKTHKFKATLSQVTAIFALGFGGVAEDKDRAYNASVLYDDARKALSECPPECSPIP